MRRNKIFSKVWLQKYFSSPCTKIYVRETANILRIFEFKNVSGRKTVPPYRLNTSVLYLHENHLSLAQS